MTIALLESYLQAFHPSAYASFRTRFLKLQASREERWESLLLEAQKQHPHAIFFYEHQERHYCLWYEQQCSEDILAAYDRLPERLLQDERLYSLLQIWKSRMERAHQTTERLTPSSVPELLRYLKRFTQAGARTLQNLLVTQGVSLDAPLDKKIADCVIHDDFYDSVGRRMDDNDAILAWYLANAMTRHIS